MHQRGDDQLEFTYDVTILVSRSPNPPWALVGVAHAGSLNIIHVT